MTGKKHTIVIHDDLYQELSTLFPHKRVSATIRDVMWNIVEQAKAPQQPR